MKMRPLFLLILLIMTVIGSGASYRAVQASFAEAPYNQATTQAAPTQTLRPTQPPVSVPPIAIPTDIPETRQLPPVGSNAGLVLGASLIVLIIIGGVFFSSRRKQKH